MATRFFILSAAGWFALSLNGGPAAAQDPGPEPPVALGLPAALARALEGNPALLALGYDIPMAEGDLLQSALRPQPELNIALQDFAGTDEFRGVNSAETTISLGWVLERGLRARLVDAARAQVDVTSAELAIARLDVLAETASRYLDCLLYQARYRNAGRGVALARDALDAVSARVAASRAPEAELARAEAQLVRAELRLEDYEHELLSAYHRLSAQWGVTEPDFEQVAGGLAEVPRLTAFEALRARVEGNPDLAVFLSQARLAEAALNLERSRARPTWRVTGGLRRMEASDDWAVVGGISIPLRLGNRNQGRIAAARARVEQVDAAAEAVRVNAATELFVLYQELVHSIQTAERLELEVEPRLAEALADTRRGFELGRRSYLEFREIQTELLDVAYEILDAHADAWRLAIELERLTGESLAGFSNSE